MKIFLEELIHQQQAVKNNRYFHRNRKVFNFKIVTMSSLII